MPNAFAGQLIEPVVTNQNWSLGRELAVKVRRRPPWPPKVTTDIGHEGTKSTTQAKKARTRFLMGRTRPWAASAPVAENRDEGN